MPFREQTRSRLTARPFLHLVKQLNGMSTGFSKASFVSGRKTLWFLCHHNAITHLLVTNTGSLGGYTFFTDHLNDKSRSNYAVSLLLMRESFIFGKDRFISLTA